MPHRVDGRSCGWGDSMTRAVHFNGANKLVNYSLKKLPEFTTDLQYYSCGALSYWYNAVDGEEGTILYAYTLNGSKVMLHISHFAFGPGMYPKLEIQRAVGSPSDLVSLLAVPDLPLQFDGKWHHVIWSWQVSLPVMGACVVDGVQARVGATVPAGAF